MAGLAMLASVAGAADDPTAKLAAVKSCIRDLETALSRICRDADAGVLKQTVTLKPAQNEAWLGQDLLTFSMGTLNRDLDKAVTLLERYKTVKLDLEKEVAKAASGGARPAKAGTLEDRIRDAETATENRAGAPAPAPDTAFNALDDFAASHKQKVADKDEAAEADMRRVAEERRAAVEESRAHSEIARKVQEQNAKWQQELDTLAQKEADAEEAWRREHGAGAFAKGLFRTVVGGAITSLTGGFASGVGTTMADRLIGKTFPTPPPGGAAP